MRIGYARVSTRDQNPEAQADRLKADGCEKTFTDEGVSGMRASRPDWDRCLDQLRSGDVLVVVRLDRIGRSVANLIKVVNLLEEKGVELVVLDQNIDTRTNEGRFLFNIMAAVAQYERDLIRERTLDGLAAARARGRTGGRKPTLSPAQVRVARQMNDARDEQGIRVHTIKDIADVFGTSRQTIYRVLEQAAPAT